MNGKEYTLNKQQFLQLRTPTITQISDILFLQFLAIQPARTVRKEDALSHDRKRRAQPPLYSTPETGHRQTVGKFICHGGGYGSVGEEHKNCAVRVRT
jgi:hypothetical protein